ncbi:unnamed protein product [Allacma fusca]|uniref:Uncharacterized protein n=1 Tax=Allacma fusca TaxID=39272 RepID=A0A8J2P1C7_9HEXA|nr:unnamed protein product [Allacma fusca]
MLGTIDQGTLRLIIYSNEFFGIKALRILRSGIIQACVVFTSDSSIKFSTLKMLNTKVLFLMALLAITMYTVEAECCSGRFGDNKCADGTFGNPCCAYGFCDLQCCGCNGQCRKPNPGSKSFFWEKMESNETNPLQ